MKILLFRFPLQPAWGGAETLTLTLAEGLRERGHEVFLLSNNRALVKTFSQTGLPAKKIWAGWEPTSVLALLLFPLTSLAGFLIFCFWIIKSDCKLVFCTTLSDKLIATPIAKLLGKKVLWIEHTRIGRWLFQNPFLFWYRLQSKNARVIAPSYFLRNQLIQAGVPVDQITVIYPGVAAADLLSPSPAFRASSPAGGEEREGRDFVIGFLGRLAKEKGVDVLLRALAFGGGAAVIAGTGPEENNLKQLAEKLGLGAQVKFLGEVADKRKFFSQINCLVVPSVEAEAFGLVIIEAMAAGVPVIASRIGAIPEIIEDKKTGLLFEPGNPDELKEKIQFMKERTISAALAKEASRTVNQRFSEGTMIRNFLDLMLPII